ncbi:hypothetical protein [Polyangium mundeleinium]|uniref:Tryptophan synthase alpha chain n=1 Tax=Polyangium mundeleinium TaxID=2995306 RepID=A0ABT5F1R9_9BACT|nr:hypothetical protein [Polyangium mundeleinium]MDC0748043.1 hypothetical protein [Polyangium mundeleinium]
MSSTNTPRALRAILASALVALVGGGCIALGYDFDRLPPIPCNRAEDCPGEDTFCGTRACAEGACTIVDVQPAGVKPVGQPLGDCQDVTCDGAGHAISKPAPEQLPTDGSECNAGQCVEGTPLLVPVEQGKSCGKDLALTCDGRGACMGCTMPSQCGDDGPCVKWACTDGACIRAYVPAGMVVADTVVGDCMAEACDGAGNLDQVPSPADAADDGDSCTDDICTGAGTEHANAANGTACGVGCQSCTEGVCGDCSPGFVCEGMACVSVGEQPVGAVCTTSSDCGTGFCVQGVCCESACDDKCMGCVKTATGMPNGVCAPALDGNNPGGRCAGADTCVGGVCRCENNVQDGNELKVDCGGSCSPCKGTWVCNGDAGCGEPIEKSCGLVCINCDDNTEACFQTQNQECFIGEQPKSFTGGSVYKFPTDYCKRMTCICQ